MNFLLNLVSLNLLFHMCKNSRPLGDAFLKYIFCSIIYHFIRR